MASWSSSYKKSRTSGAKLKPVRSAPKTVYRDRARAPGRKPPNPKVLPGRPAPVPSRPAPATPATPAAPAAATQLSRPVDPFFDAAMGGAMRDYAAQMQQAQFAQSQLGPTFGIGITPTGSVYDDPSNPFSRAAAMQAAYMRDKQMSTTTMASRGQLYSGALQNAQNENALNHERNRDRLIREFQAAQQAIQAQQLAAGNLLQDRQAQAESESLQRAVDERTDPDTALGLAAAMVAQRRAAARPTSAPASRPKSKPKAKPKPKPQNTRSPQRGRR